MNENVKNTDKSSNDTIHSVRRSALDWWKSQLGRRYQIMVIHRNKVLNAEKRHPTDLTGREIEILYKAEV